MNGLTNHITERPWEAIITTWYVLVDDAYQRLLAQRGCRIRTSGPAPSFSDSEVITVALIIETFFQGHEELGYAVVSRIYSACGAGRACQSQPAPFDRLRARLA